MHILNKRIRNNSVKNVLDNYFFIIMTGGMSSGTWIQNSIYNFPTAGPFRYVSHIYLIKQHVSLDTCTNQSESGQIFYSDYFTHTSLNNAVNSPRNFH